MWTSSYGMRTASASAIRSRRESRLSSESTSWKISARRRYGSTAGPPPMPAGIRAAPEVIRLTGGGAAGSMGAGSDMTETSSPRSSDGAEAALTPVLRRSAVVGTAEDARVALLSRLIDHAPLFPPASLPLSEAIEEDRRARESGATYVLGRFVCPASLLEE